MPPPTVLAPGQLGQLRDLSGSYSANTPLEVSAVSWGAILAGAAVAAVMSLVLLILGTGLGLSSVSPWAQEGISASTFGVTAIIWLILTQLVASGMGGYIAGRLRTKWGTAQTDEVYFRDTAHGFLAWAIASLATAALLTSMIGSIVSGGVQAGGSVVEGVASATAVTGSSMIKSDANSGSLGYLIDSMFRRNVSPSAGSAKGEAVLNQAPEASVITRIFITTLRAASLPAEDVRYIGGVVSYRTGLTQQEAEKRVNDTFARVQTMLRETETAAREAADAARKASAYAALWLFVSLLIGAFVASFAATIGGRQRDL